MYLPRLKQLRKERGYTQQHIANLLHISRVGYCYYEIGKRNPSYDTIVFLSELYSVTTDYIVGLSDHRYHEIV